MSECFLFRLTVLLYLFCCYSLLLDFCVVLMQGLVVFNLFWETIGIVIKQMHLFCGFYFLLIDCMMIVVGIFSCSLR